MLYTMPGPVTTSIAQCLCVLCLVHSIMHGAWLASNMLMLRSQDSINLAVGWSCAN